MAKFTITPSYHSVKRINIWTVKPSEKLEYSDYKKLESKIKTIGGYYSRFSRAFVFESEPSMDKLNEAFGDTQTVSETAKQMGVSESKIALIDLTDNDFRKIDRRTLKKEYDARKLLITKTGYYDGMIDGSRSIPESEWKWNDRDFGFEEQFNYSTNPYAAYGAIKFGDYRAKYKEDIIMPVKSKSTNQSSINYYVDLEDKKVNDEYAYELDRIDSDSKDHEKGERVVMSFYGNKYCGYISDKRVSQYQTRTWSYGSNIANVETNEIVSYTVTLDNGVVNGSATFKIDTENECNEISADAIFFENAYKLPESFWSSDIVRKISGINGMKRQKSSRKKAEYAMQDQKMIDRSELALMKNFALWLGWEQKNMDYSRKITGESEEEQNFRMDKWMNEFKVDPIRLVRPKSVLINKLIRANNLLLN